MPPARRRDAVRAFSRAAGSQRRERDAGDARRAARKDEPDLPSRQSTHHVRVLRRHDERIERARSVDALGEQFAECRETIRDRKGLGGRVRHGDGGKAGAQSKRRSRNARRDLPRDEGRGRGTRRTRSREGETRARATDQSRWQDAHAGDGRDHHARTPRAAHGDRAELAGRAQPGAFRPASVRGAIPARSFPRARARGWKVSAFVSLASTRPRPSPVPRRLCAF